MKKILYIFFVLILSLKLNAEDFVNLVIATVNNEPITLNDLNSKSIKEKFSADNIKLNKNARKLLDVIINQKLIIAEAKERGLNTTEREIDSYFNSIAKRNNLTKDKFIKVIEKEGQTAGQFREYLEFEIYKSKLLENLISNKISVSDSEINNFLRENNLNMNSQKIKINQIFIPENNKISPDEIYSRINKNNFETIAQKYSFLKNNITQVMNLNELSPQIKKELIKLKEKEFTQPIKLGKGYYIFQMLKKTGEKDDNSAQTKELAKQKIYEIKSQKLLNKALEEEIKAKHTIDIKI